MKNVKVGAYIFLEKCQTKLIQVVLISKNLEIHFLASSDFTVGVDKICTQDDYKNALKGDMDHKKNC